MNTTDSIRRLRGGSGPSPSFGPCIVNKSYDTVAYGPSDAIAAGPGEVLVQIASGSPETFSQWLVGPVAEMIVHLRSVQVDGRLIWTEDKVRWARGMAAKIEAQVNDQAPIARLARALGVPVERVAEMATLAKVAIEDGI